MAQPTKKMTTSSFSEFVMDMSDLYDLGVRNGFYLPSSTSTAINEVALLNILQGLYWCPKYDDMRMRPCPKPPMKELLIEKLMAVAHQKKLNVAWIDDRHLPDKKWLVDVLATLAPSDEIFRKDYQPPTRQRHKLAETIQLPAALFENMVVSKSKAKRRNLKVISEGLALERAQMLKKTQKKLGDEIILAEQKADEYKQRRRAKQ